MSTDTGGPAFPTKRRIQRAGYATDEYEPCGGMALRDYFAIRAIPGLMARNWSHHTGTDEELIAVWARSAYGVADAMLKAREA